MPSSFSPRRKISSMSYSLVTVLGSTAKLWVNPSSWPPLMYLSVLRIDCQRRYFAEVLYTSSQSPTSEDSSKSSRSPRRSRQSCSSSLVSLVTLASVSSRPSRPQGFVSTSSRLLISVCSSDFTRIGSRLTGTTEASPFSSSCASSSSSYSKRSSIFDMRSLKVSTSMESPVAGSSAHISRSSSFVISPSLIMPLISEISNSASKDRRFWSSHPSRKSLVISTFSRPGPAALALAIAGAFSAAAAPPACRVASASALAAAVLRTTSDRTWFCVG
mmetsp:Transcript_68935/g.190829  ORF Transcript_68935/g.190829 Transcript_68935/m.190829 type:complete len:274 (+) Transcript_68935:548-1369(+)